MRAFPVLAGLLTAAISVTIAAAAELPAPIRVAGTFHLSINATYAPMDYHDPSTNALSGLDLAAAIAKRLGVGIEWTDGPFDQLIPSLQTGRTDFAISGFSDRASRREGMDFVNYLGTGPQFFVLADSPAQTSTDLCGKEVGTVRSNSFPAEIEKWSKAYCKAAIQYIPGENSVDVRNQLKQGRVDAAVQESETPPYAATSSPAARPAR